MPFSPPELMLIIWIFSFALTVFGTWEAIRLLKRNSLQAHNEGLEPVSILKPLKGIDDGLYENLESFFQLDYPEFELLFSVADANDPVIEVVEGLRSRYPQVTSELFIGAIQSGLNPKVNNMLKAYDSAHHEWILVSDSNTRVRPDHLRRLAAQFKDEADMQSSIVAGVAPLGLGGRLEATFLNTVYARSVVTLHASGHTCVMGKAMMFRKSAMYHTRGLRSLQTHIAEDYAAGRKFEMLGYRVQLSQLPIRQHIGHHSLGAFWKRHIRWGRIRKMQAPIPFLFEPLLSSVLSGVIGAAGAALMWQVSISHFLAMHFAMWFICDLWLASKVGDAPGLLFLPVWIIRELTHLPLWMHIAIGSTVTWRGQVIQLKRVPILERRADALERENLEIA